MVMNILVSIIKLTKGYFKSDTRHGLGQLTTDAGMKVFKGYWSRNLRNGNGVILYRDKREEFHGCFKDDKKEGFALVIERVYKLLHTTI